MRIYKAKRGKLEQFIPKFELISGFHGRMKMIGQKENIQS